MTKFEIPDWEQNTIEDRSCKEISQVRSDASVLNRHKKGKLKSNISKVSKIIKKDNAFKKANKKTKHQTVEIEQIVSNSKSKTHFVNDVTTKREKSSTIMGKRKKNNISTKPPLNVNKKVKEMTLKKTNIETNEQGNQTSTHAKVNNTEHKDTVASTPKKNKNAYKLQKLKQKLVNMEKTKKTSNEVSLRDRMMSKLKAARFRYINEQIYSTESKHAMELFKEDPAAFHAYHEGYRQQIAKWPLNPLDTIISSISKMPQNRIVADFGCGEARLAKSVNQKVHSFDLVAANESVVACDMAKVPLKGNSVDVVVFCLSLMGTNLTDYLLEANRILKVGGILKIAEVESRFDRIETFLDGVKRMGFSNTWKDLTHNLFYFLDFRKDRDIKKKNKIPVLSLQPCLYKKR